jgi:hypothetical protein
MRAAALGGGRSSESRTRGITTGSSCGSPTPEGDLVGDFFTRDASGSGMLQRPRDPGPPPDVHGRLPPLRTRLDDRYPQQNRFRLGRGLRRTDIVAAAMIDRLVHHAEIVALGGDDLGL